MPDYNIQIADPDGNIVIDGIYPNLHVLARGNSSQLVNGITLFDWSGPWMFGSAVINLPATFHTDNLPLVLLRTNADTSLNVRWYAYNGARVTGPGMVNQVVLLWSKPDNTTLWFEWVVAGTPYSNLGGYGLALWDANGALLYHSNHSEIVHLDSATIDIKRWRAASVAIPHTEPFHWPAQIPYFVGGTGAHVDGWNYFSDSGTHEGFTVLFSSGAAPANSVVAAWQQFTWNGGSGMPGWGGAELSSIVGYTQLSDVSTTTLTVPVTVVVCEVPPT